MISILLSLVIVGQVANLRADCQSAQTSCWTTYTVPKAGGGLIHIYYRTENGAISQVRPVNEEHDYMDTAGLPVTRLANIDPEQSVQFLGTLVPGTKGAIAAVALHDTASADRVLDPLVAPDQPESIRKEAATWFGIARGRHGTDQLLRLVREDASARVRSQALFWLANSAQRKIAAGAISSALENDPDTSVKRQAVFALSRLPDGEGVTKLIDVAKNNRNPAVRRQAVFWLGQSKDPRAFEFIEDLLTH